MYYYRYSSTSLTTTAEDCLVTFLVISSVDVSDLNENDIRVIVESNYSDQLKSETNVQSNKNFAKPIKLIPDAVNTSNKINEMMDAMEANGMLCQMSTKR